MGHDPAIPAQRLLFEPVKDNYGTRLALVFGNEASGLPSNLGTALHGSVTIPMAAGTESLNVAMSAAVLCFEAARRRQRNTDEPS